MYLFNLRKNTPISLTKLVNCLLFFSHIKSKLDVSVIKTTSLKFNELPQLLSVSIGVYPYHLDTLIGIPVLYSFLFPRVKTHVLVRARPFPHSSFCVLVVFFLFRSDVVLLLIVSMKSSFICSLKSLMVYVWNDLSLLSIYGKLEDGRFRWRTVNRFIQSFWAGKWHIIRGL